MSEEKKSQKGVWIGLIAVAIALAVVFYSTRQGNDDPVIEDTTETIVPDTKTEEPIDPDGTPDGSDMDVLEKTQEILNRQSITIPGLELGMGSGEAENLIEARLKPETSEGNQTYDLKMTPQTENGYTLMGVADNMMDDSVQAQEITAIFRPGQREAFVLSEYTVRVKCRRGANAGQWQTQVCP